MKKLIVAACAVAALALPAAPALATDDAGSARAGVRNCQDRHAGYRGVYVWWYDLDNNYHETKTCIYVGP